ncbi:hypothetical protein BVY03_05020, partial [bacterium K02(2017)]
IKDQDDVTAELDFIYIEESNDLLSFENRLKGTNPIDNFQSGTAGDLRIWFRDIDSLDENIEYTVELETDADHLVTFGSYQFPLEKCEEFNTSNGFDGTEDIGFLPVLSMVYCDVSYEVLDDYKGFYTGDEINVSVSLIQTVDKYSKSFTIPGDLNNNSIVIAEEYKSYFNEDTDKKF